MNESSFLLWFCIKMGIGLVGIVHIGGSNTVFSDFQVFWYGAVEVSVDLLVV